MKLLLFAALLLLSVCSHVDVETDRVIALAKGLEFGNSSVGSGDIVADMRESFKLWNRAFADPYALFSLGVNYMTGWMGADKDSGLAVMYLVMAAAEGSVEAQVTLGYMHSLGIIVPQMCDKSVQFYELASRTIMGDPDFLPLPPPPPALKQHLSLQVQKEDSEMDKIAQFLGSSAKFGDAKSAFAIGDLLYHGHGELPRDLQKAAEFLEIADDARSKARLGTLYALGLGVKKNVGKGLQLLRDAASENDSVAENTLGYMYLRGIGVDVNATEGVLLISKSAKAANLNAYYNIGLLMMLGPDVDSILPAQRPKMNIPSPVRIEFRKGKNKKIVTLLPDGRPSKRDFGLAFYAFEQASRSGKHLLATHKVALMLAKGIGVKQDCSSAVDAFKSVVRLCGKWDPEFESAFEAARGKSPVYAVGRYLRLAMMGFEPAQSNAGELLGNPDVVRLYRQRETGERDRLQILERLYAESAMQGNSLSAFLVGKLLLNQDSDLDRALRWFTVAAQRGDGRASFYLGWLCHFGVGNVPQDFHLAKRFYDAASHDKLSQWPSRLARTLLFLQRKLWKVSKALDLVFHDPETYDLVFVDEPDEPPSALETRLLVVLRGSKDYMKMIPIELWVLGVSLVLWWVRKLLRAQP